MRKERVNINFNTQNNNQIKANFKSNNQEIQPTTTLRLKLHMGGLENANDMAKLEYGINVYGVDEQRPPALPAGTCLAFDPSYNFLDYALVTNYDPNKTVCEADYMVKGRHTKLFIEPEKSNSTEYLTALMLQAPANTEVPIKIPAGGIITNAKQLSLSGEGFADGKYDLISNNNNTEDININYTMSADGQDIILINLNEEPDHPLGDINGDGTVNIFDAIRLVDHINAVNELNTDEQERANRLPVNQAYNTSINVFHIIEVIKIINA